MKKILAIAALLIAGSVASVSYADDIALGEPGYGGTGCPDGSALVTLSPDAYTVTFDVDGQQLVYDHRAARPMKMTWPGPGEGRVEVAVTPEIPGQQSRLDRRQVCGACRVQAGQRGDPA